MASLTAAPGTYVLTVVGLGSSITDLSGNPLLTGATTSWTLQTPTNITVQPVGGLAANGTESFAATALDQFGNPLASQPQFAWSLIGDGQISSTGVFTPPYTVGTATIQATSGSITGSDIVALPGLAQWDGNPNTSWNTVSSWMSSAFGSAVENPGLRDVSGDGVVFNLAAGGAR